MANDYYTRTADLDPATLARSGVVEGQFDGVEAGFDLLPSITKTQSANPSFVAAGGTANAITVANPLSTWASYTGKDGYKINIQITTTNTSSVTLAVDGLATKACKRNDGTALQAGDLVAAGFYDFIYDETAGYFVCPEAINGVLTDATAQAVAAAASASSASTSASTATTQASSATSSASSASTSASTATTQASNASASATLASQWASNPEDDDVTGGEFSAKHYSIKAAASAATAGANMAGQINGATAKSPLVDNDEFGIADSATAYGLKKTLWSTIKSGIWTALGALISGGTDKAAPVGADLFALSDSAASNATKKVTLTNIAAFLASLSQTLTNKTLTDPAITGAIVEDVYTITDGAAFEIDPSNGTIQKITLGASRTPAATNFANGESVLLGVNDGSAYTIIWTTVGVVWVGGSAPTLEASGYTWIELWKESNIIRGVLVGGTAT